MQPSDRELIARCAAGDRRAFEGVIRRHGPALLAYLTRMTGERTAAEDALQSALLSAYRHASTFRGESARAWLISIARNEALRQAKRRVPEPMEPNLLDLGAAAGWGTSDPETLTSLAQERTRLEQALNALRPAEREVLVLRDVQQLSGPETAEALAIPLRAMKSRLHRARLRLAVELRRLGGTA